MIQVPTYISDKRFLSVQKLSEAVKQKNVSSTAYSERKIRLAWTATTFHLAINRICC